MDLLASYASDDDDNENPTAVAAATTTAVVSVGATTNSLFSTLPPPKPSLFAALPPPKPSLFAAIPPPKSAPSSPAADHPPKRVVKFTPPVHPSLLNPNNSDDSDDDRKRRKLTDNSSSAAPGKPFSSVLPAPKNSLCLAPAPSRRSVLQAPTSPTESCAQPQIETPAATGGFGPEAEVSGYENYGSYSGGSYDVASYGGDVAGYGGYGGDWSDVSMAAAVMPAIPEFGRIAGKRGRNVIPTEIVEVNQDELMKNRPREDQTKLTGVAFGPAYQPVSSSKGKPSKLHKRKHQIGSLYFDMKQKEMELSERRSRGLLTKAETHAKYGW